MRGGGDPHPFYLRPANEVTKRDLRHALTNMPSNAHPFCLTALYLRHCAIYFTYLYVFRVPTHICIYKINAVFRNLLFINIFKYIQADDNLLEKSFGTLRKYHF